VLCQYIDASQNNKSKRSVRSYIFKDLDLDFNRNTVTNDVIPKVEDVNAVKRSVRNLVQTNYYERPFHPELGCGIRELLFEPYTPTYWVYFIRRKIEEVYN
jgi:phage baseplate assembly protein W